MDNNYYNTLETVLTNVKARILQVENLNPDELDQTTDYSFILFKLYQAQRKIERMLAVSQYLRVSKESFLQGTQPFQSVEISYTVTSFDNIFNIAKKYSTTVDAILEINNVTIAEIKTGDVLRILVPSQIQSSAITNNYPVYGSLDGDAILGVDLPNKLIDNGNGDLALLSPEDTIRQGVLNTVTTRAGDYPGESFGLDYMNREGVSNNVYQSLLMLKLNNLLEADARINSVGNITLTNNQDKNSIQGTFSIETVNKQDITVTK
jgi:LysM repeat protein